MSRDDSVANAPPDWRHWMAALAASIAMLGCGAPDPSSESSERYAARCGAEGERCCQDGSYYYCNSGLSCDPSTKRCGSGGSTQPSCGGLGQACCDGNTCNSNLAACVNGICVGSPVACVPATADCCGGVFCEGGHICRAAVCVVCGGLGQPCCSGDACADGVCSNGACVPADDACGKAGKPCCSGDSCSDGSECRAGVCVPCGREGQTCCNIDLKFALYGGTCDEGYECTYRLESAWPLLTVGGPECNKCGGLGEWCCVYKDGPNSTPSCDSNYACIGGRCR